MKGHRISEDTTGIIRAGLETGDLVKEKSWGGGYRRTALTH